MTKSFLLRCSPALLAAMLLLPPGCASHPRDFVPNGAGQNLPPTNPAHIQALDSIPPNSMVIGDIFVNRAEAANTDDIIAKAKQRAASVGGDFIVWQDSVGAAAVPSATPVAEPSRDTGFGHTNTDNSTTEPGTLFHGANFPKARFTVGIFLQGAGH